MSAAAVLAQLTEAGVTLETDGDRLTASPAGRVTVAHRDLIRAYRPALVALLSSPEHRRFRLWLIRHPDGSLASHSFCPPATLPEVRAWYPGAQIEPDACGSFPVPLPAGRKAAESR